MEALGPILLLLLMLKLTVKGAKKNWRKSEVSPLFHLTDGASSAYRQTGHSQDEFLATRNCRSRIDS